MRTRNAKTRVPTAVSLMLIFAYSMLMVAVPPTQSGATPAQNELAPTSAEGERLLRASVLEPARDDAEPTLQ